jgi:carbonic anhydrase
VVRNLAALVPPYRGDVEYSSMGAALEFAVRTLGVRLIVVLGHSHCGGILALIDGMPEDRGEFVTPWVQIAAPALEAVPDHLEPAEHLSRCEAEVARLSLANLQTYPWVLDAVTGEELALEALRFDVASGVLSRLNSGGFVPLD